MEADDNTAMRPATIAAEPQGSELAEPLWRLVRERWLKAVSVRADDLAETGAPEVSEAA